MGDTTQEVVKILLEMKDFQDKMDKINSDFATSINNATKLGQVVDAISGKFDALQTTVSDALKTIGKLNNVVNNKYDYSNRSTVNNSTNYKNTFSKGNYTISGTGGTAYSAPNARTKGYKAAEKEYLKTQKEYNKLLAEQVNLEKEKAKYLAEQTKYYAENLANKTRDSESKAKSSQAQLLRAQYFNSFTHLDYERALTEKKDALKGFYEYQSAHPELFVSGATKRDPRYQFGVGLMGIGNALGTVGVGSDKLEGRLIGGVLSTVGNIIRTPVAGVAASFISLAKGARDLTEVMTKSYAEINATRTQLGVVFSSQTQADSMFREISQYAVKSPFGVQQTSELAILLKQSGVYASDLMDTLKMLGDTAGGNMEKMKRIANNYAQIVSIGKASMLDMRQFAYAGIPIFEAISKELKISQKELRKMISDGQITSEIVEKVFKDLTGINGIFGNATEKGAKTLKARLQNLQDAKQLAMGSMGEWVFNLGKTTTNDTIPSKVLSVVENIYSHINDKVDTRNIENSVKNIEKRDTELSNIESLIEKYEKEGNKKYVKLLKARRDELLNAVDIDRERADYSTLAKVKTKDVDKLPTLLSSLGIKMSDYIDNYDSLDSVLKEMEKGNLKNRFTNYTDYWNKYRNNSIGPITRLLDQANMHIPSTIAMLYGFNKGFKYDVGEGGLSYKNLVEQKDAIKEARNIIKQFSALTDKEREYLNESLLLESQDKAYSETSKKEDFTTSLNTSFKALADLYDKSDEVVKAKQLKTQEDLLGALQDLKFLSSKTRNGILKMDELTLQDYITYKDKGAFTALDKLDVVKKNTTEQKDEKKYLLNEQLRWFVNLAKDSLSVDDMNVIVDKFSQLENIENLDTYFKEVPKFYKTVQDLLTKLAEENPNDNDVYKSLKRALLDTTYKLGVDDRAKNLDPKIITSMTKSLEPLWKRLASSVTGWSLQHIGTGPDFISQYQKFASRQIASEGIAGLLSTYSGLSSVDSHLRMSNGKVDWETTGDDLIKYATRFSTSVEESAKILKKMSASMTNQLNVYSTLTNKLYTVGEDWGTIDNWLKQSENDLEGLDINALYDNAFTAINHKSGRYSVSYDKENGTIIKNKEGYTVGALKDLKLIPHLEETNKELKQFIDAVDIEAIKQPLKEATLNMAALVDVTNIANSLSSQALTFQKQTYLTYGNAWGGSIGAIGTLTRASGYDNIIPEAQSILNDYLSNFAGTIAALKLDDYSDESIEKAYQKITGKNSRVNKRQVQDIRNASRAFNSTSMFDYTESANAIERLLNLFGKNTQDLVDNAEALATATKEKSYVSTSSDLLKLITNKALIHQTPRLGNSEAQQNLLEVLGYNTMSFSRLSKGMTEQAFQMGFEGEFKKLMEGYLKEGGKMPLTPSGLEMYEKYLNQGKYKEAELVIGKENFKKITEKVNYEALLETLDPEVVKEKAGQAFTPLWKRILASKTGLTTQGMTSTAQTLGNYTNDMAIRNLTSNVLKATLSEFRADSAMSLVKSSKTALKLKGTSDYTYQVDWAETKKALKSFALSLSASTKVIEAYKKGLEDELAVYEDLIVSGYTEAESQDLNKQKYISTNTLSRFAQDAESQLVNAFGEKFMTKSGKEVKWGADNQFYDIKTGKAIEEEVVLTGNLFELIKKELPRVREELHEATKAEIRNKEFGKIVGANQKNGLYLRDIFTQSGLTRSSLYLANNIDSYEEVLKSLWDNKHKNSIGTDKIKNLSYEDLKMYSLSYNPYLHNEESIETEARNMLLQIMSDFVETWKNDKTDLFAETANIKSAGGAKDFAIASDLLNLDYKSVEEMLKPENKEGFRGIKAKFLKTLGLESSYDMEDVYDLVNRLGWEEKGISAGFESGDKKEANKIENLIDKQFAVENLKETLSSVGEELLKINNDFSKGLWEKPFEKWTENLVKGKDLMEDMDDVMKGLAADTLEAAGASMQKAGWELVANGAATKNIGMVAAGFGLAAAGGASKGLANALNSKDTEKDEADKSLEKLNKLKDDLRDLLKQAREDSIYYENTTRHKKAITIGSSLSGTKVNDAIIAPNGNVITTHPDDYLIATKTPQRLGNSMAAPIVNIKNIDNSNGVNIKSKVNYNPATNTVDIEAVIENKVADFIASERSDMAFQVREQRRSGQQYVG